MAMHLEKLREAFLRSHGFDVLIRIGLESISLFRSCCIKEM